MDLGCGITFDIFTHVLHGSFEILLIHIARYIKIHNGALDEGYNVVRAEK